MILTLGLLCVVVIQGGLLAYLALAVWRTARTERFPLPEIGALMQEAVNEAVKKADERVRKRFAGVSPALPVTGEALVRAQERAQFEEMIKGGKL